MTGFPQLRTLVMRSNHLSLINLSSTNTFKRLSSLDLSYNYIIPSEISNLACILNLKQAASLLTKFKDPHSTEQRADLPSERPGRVRAAGGTRPQQQPLPIRREGGCFMAGVGHS